MNTFHQLLQSVLRKYSFDEARVLADALEQRDIIQLANDLRAAGQNTPYEPSHTSPEKLSWRDIVCDLIYLSQMSGLPPLTNHDPLYGYQYNLPGTNRSDKIKKWLGRK